MSIASHSSVPRCRRRSSDGPVCAEIAPHRLVTVDLRLVPVMPTIGAAMKRLASSISGDRNPGGAGAAATASASAAPGREHDEIGNRGQNLRPQTTESDSRSRPSVT